MDKKYIHIDDLSRQVLGQREEEPRPGAWMTMRDLLDKQMPAGALPATGFAWKRYLSAALILLLLSLATIGGFHLSDTPSDGELAMNEPAQLPAAVASANRNSTANNGLAATPGLENSGSSFPATEAGMGVSAAEPAVASAPAEATPAAIAPSVAALPALMPLPGSLEGATVRKPATARKATLNQTAATPATADAQPFAAQTSALSENPATASLLPAAAHSGTDRTAAPATAKNKTGNTSAPAKKNTPAGNNGKPNDLKEPHAGTAVASGAGSQKVKKMAAPKKNMMLVRDTIQQIQIVQRMVPGKNPRGVYEPKFDTISITDLVQEKWVQTGPAYAGIGPSQETAPVRQQQVLSAAPAMRKTEDGAGSYVTLNSRQTSSRTWSANTITLKERMEKAMLQLSQIRAYTGMVAGVGFSPGKLATYGFHLGLSHAFQLDDKWTLFGEFKYQRQMGRDLILRDDYSESYAMNRSIQGSNTMYNWKTDSVEHYFKVSALQSVVVPVNLQYNLNRLFFMGGVSFSYSPRINSEEVKRYHNQPTTHSFTGNPSYTQMPPGYEAGQPGIAIDDFGGRISLGYQLGAGYELSPALKLDFRCSQQFWDNAATSGARKVSKEFYRLPNLQLSVGYRFGNGK